MNNVATKPATKNIYGRELTVAVDSLIHIDGWMFGTRLMASEWDGAQFRVQSCQYDWVQPAVNVEIVGRSWQRRAGSLWVRVSVEFVHDGEPNVMHRGWMEVGWN